MRVTVHIQKLRPDAILPRYATPASAAMDLFACLDAPVTLRPGARLLIPTGLSAALPSSDMAILIFGRSGLGFRHGITLSNAVGVIDADYRGEICVSLTHLGDTPYVVHPGDRIAQMAVFPLPRVEWLEQDVLPETDRGAGGFGSTGR